MSESAKTDWHFNHVVANATAEQLDRIWDAFIDAVEKESLICGGNFHPLGHCRTCREEDGAA